MPTAIDKERFFTNVNYRPHEKQWLFHRSQARFRLPVCGRRFGKSRMSAMDMLPELFVPDRRYWIVGPTYDLGEREFRVIWDTLKQYRLMGPETDIKGTYNRANGKMWIQFPWNTRLEVRSADHPESLVGDSLHGVIMSEAAKQQHNTWQQYIRPALTDYKGWATFPTTPEGTANWVYDLWRMGQNPEEPDYESWQFPSWSNPFVYPKGEFDTEILAIKRETATPIFLQEYGASFAAFQGQIYPEFDEKVHVRPIKYNPEWPNYISWDFGFAAPLAAVEFQVDPMDRVYVWREHYAANMTLEQHVEYMKGRHQPPGYKVDMMFGDSADPEAIETLNRTWAPTVGDPKAKENWRAGISKVKRFLLPRDENAAPGQPGSEPSLFIDNSCDNTIKEHINYRAVAAVRDLDPRERAKSSSDHTCDALRYGLMHVFHLGYRANGIVSEMLVRSGVEQVVTEIARSGAGPANSLFLNRNDYIGNDTASLGGMQW